MLLRRIPVRGLQELPPKGAEVQSVRGYGKVVMIEIDEFLHRGLHFLRTPRRLVRRVMTKVIDKQGYRFRFAVPSLPDHVYDFGARITDETVHGTVDVWLFVRIFHNIFMF